MFELNKKITRKYFTTNTRYCSKIFIGVDFILIMIIGSQNKEVWLKFWQQHSHISLYYRVVHMLWANYGQKTIDTCVLGKAVLST